MKANIPCLMFPYSWVKELPTTFERLGLVNARSDRFTTRPEFGRLHDDTLFWTVEDFSHNTLDRRPETRYTGKGQRARDLVAKAYEDSVKGAFVRSDFVVVIGQKSEH